jgi:hypothetical protein
VKDLGQNLQTFDDARSRAVEILFAVGDEDATLLSSLQLVPTPGRRSRSGISRSVRAMSKPQGCTRTTSGSEITTSSQSSHGEGWPYTSRSRSAAVVALPSGLENGEGKSRGQQGTAKQEGESTAHLDSLGAPAT